MLVGIIFIKLRSDKKIEEEDQSYLFEDPKNLIKGENCSGTAPDGDFKVSKSEGFRPRNC